MNTNNKSKLYDLIKNGGSAECDNTVYHSLKLLPPFERIVFFAYGKIIEQLKRGKKTTYIFEERTIDECSELNISFNQLRYKLKIYFEDLGFTCKIND